LAPIADLTPIEASPLSNASAKENISSFNRLASVAISANNKKNGANDENREQNKVTFKASPNNNTNASTRRPLGALSTRGNIPRHVSLVKKPSGNSQGGKALKLLGENGDKDRTRGKESTNVKDRVKEWEREKERLREMARLEEMQRENDDLYEKKKKERVKEKAKKIKVDDCKEKGEEEEKKTGNDLEKELEKEKEIDTERKSSKKDVSLPALQIVDPASEWEWNKENMDSSAISAAPFMFRSNPPLTQGLSSPCCHCHGYDF
jgi:serine/threonine-protein kinase GIN4